MDLWMDVDVNLSEVPVNLLPLIDDTDFKSIEADVNYNATGLVLIWHFITTGGVYTQTAVTPTDTGGNYDWVEQGNGLFTIEIPASGGATINNDTEGFGWFTGVATGILPWRGPIIGFRAAGLNNVLIDTAYSETRGLAGTALPAAAADGVGGLPISDAGGLDMDAILSRIGTPANLGGGTATLAGNLADIEGQTDDIGAAGAGLTAVPWNAAWDAEVESEVNDALVVQKLDHLVAVADADDVVNDSIIAKLASKSATADWSGFVNTTDSLEANADAVAAIDTSIGTIAPTTDASDSFTQTYGTVISGNYTNTQSDDNNRHVLAPELVNGLDATYLFQCGAGRAPTAVTINGYWAGSGSYADVYAYDYGLAIWDKLTNTSTYMNNKSADQNYVYTLNREHMNPADGEVSVRFVSPSVNTAHRLNLDRILVNTIDDGTAGGGGGITAQDVWEYVTRTLTSDTGEALTGSEIADAVWDEASTGHTDAGKAGAQLWTQVDAILEDTGTTLDDLVDGLETAIGTPVALDSGLATISGMLTKMADDNSGATFDATYDSLNKIKGAVTAGVATALQAGSNVETTGTLVSGTYANTYLSNGSYYITAPVSPAVGGFGLNVYLGFTAAADQYVNSVTIRGYFAAAAARNVNVYAYNWGTLAWDQLSDSTTRMNNASTNQLYNYTLLSSHKKADGTVQIGFKSASVTLTDRLNIDQCIVNVATAGASAADIAEAVKQKLIVNFYEAGVWIDTVNGTAGTVLGTNGTPTNPSSTYADALVIASILGVKRFYLKPGTSITLTQDHTGWRFIGAGSIALGGQVIADCVFEDVYTISGTSTGDDAEFFTCGIGTATIAHAYFHDCKFKGTLTLVAAQDYFFLNCSDTTPSAGNVATFVFAANATAVFRDWCGGIQINSLAATNDCIIDGAGRVVIDASSTAGSLTIRGHFPAATGASTFTTLPNTGTITDTARWAEDQNITNATGDVQGKVLGGGASTITGVGAWADLRMILGTLLTETSGYLAAGFKKLFNVATPVMTMENVNQTGDSYGVVTNATYGLDKLARTGADSDTLETLSDQLDTAQADLDNPSQYMANVSGLALQASVDDLESRLTAARAGYLDNLSAGAVALDSTVAKDATVAKSATALSNATWTNTRAGNLDNLDATVSSRSTHSAADVWAVGTRTLTSFGTLVSDIATAVWAAVVRTLTSSGAPTAADVADAVWDEPIGAHANPASTGVTLAGLSTNVSSVLTDTGTTIPAQISGLNNLSAAQVNAQVVDALTVDVIADSIPADGTRPTIAQSLYMLTQFMVERGVSGTTVTVNKPDGTTALFTLTLNDASSPTAITRAT